MKKIYVECPNCGHDISVEPSEHDKQIRTEAIDEYFEIIKKHEDMLGCVMICQCESIAEQLKEQK